MITGSVERRRRGGFMSANSAVQHLSSGLGAYIGGQIITRTPAGAIHSFDKVGYIAVAFTLISLWVAGRVRPAVEPEAISDHFRPRERAPVPEVSQMSEDSR